MEGFCTNVVRVPAASPRARAHSRLAERSGASRACSGDASSPYNNAPRCGVTTNESEVPSSVVSLISASLPLAVMMLGDVTSS